MSDAGQDHGLRVAYLVSQYPALSHTFIEAEVSALRRQGVRVDTFSVRASGVADHPENESTFSLKGQRPVRYLGAAARVLLSSPRTLARGVASAIRNGSRRSARARLWQFFYLAEAVLLVDEMRRRRLRHVHVHFANNGADIARLAVDLGNGPGADAGWTWSLTVHGPTEFEDVAEHDLARKVSQATFTACITDFCRSQLMRHTDPAVWDRLHVVRAGLPAEVLDKANASPMPEAHSQLRVLFVGRLVPEKGPGVLLQAAALLARRSPERALDLVYVGNGELRQRLEEQAADLPPQVSVRFLGGLRNDQVLPWYGWADVFCLPSFSEGLPIVLMEALAHGLAVVTTPIAGIPELVVSDRTGVLVPPGRHDRLAEALDTLGRHADERRRLGADGQVAVRRLHQVDSNVRTLAELFVKATTEREDASIENGRSSR